MRGQKGKISVAVFSFFLCAFISMPDFSYAQDGESEIPAEVSAFLKSFEAALISGNTEKVMSMMEEDYRRGQHDALLKGNTQQFLNEFQCGYRVDNPDTFECIDFGKVKSMELTEIIPDENVYILLYKLTGPSSEVNVTWMISVVEEGGKKIYGMVGAYG